MQIMIKIAAVATVLFFCGCTTVKNVVRKNNALPESKLIEVANETSQINRMKSDKEGSLGFVSEDFVDQYIIESRSIEALLADIKDKIITAYPHEFTESVTIYLTYQNDYAAHATSNNNIFIPSGWLIDAESEDEIAALIAHELSHLILYHPPTSISRFQQQKGVESFSSLAVLLKTLASLDKTADSFEVKSSELNNIRNIQLVGAGLLEIKKSLIDPKLSRQQEEEADFLAIDLLVKAGYNHNGLADLFDRLHTLQARKELQIKVQEQALKDLQKQQYQRKRHTKAKTPTDSISQLTEIFPKFFSKKREPHFRPEVRKEKMSAYLNQYYEDGVFIPPVYSRNEFLAAKKTTQLQMLHQIHKELDEANAMIDKGRTRQGAKIALASLKTPAKDSAMPWVVLSKARLIQRKYKDVDENLNLVIKTMKFPPLDAYTLLAESKIMQQDYLSAQKIIQQGTQKFQDETPFMIHEAVIACKQKNHEHLNQSLKSCQSNDNPRISSQCNQLKNNINLEKAKENYQGQWWKGCKLATPFTIMSIKNNNHKQKLY